MQTVPQNAVAAATKTAKAKNLDDNRM